MAAMVEGFHDSGVFQLLFKISRTEQLRISKTNVRLQVGPDGKGSS